MIELLPPLLFYAGSLILVGIGMYELGFSEGANRPPSLPPSPPAGRDPHQPHLYVALNRGRS